MYDPALVTKIESTIQAPALRDGLLFLETAGRCDPTFVRGQHIVPSAANKLREAQCLSSLVKKTRVVRNNLPFPSRQGAGRSIVRLDRHDSVQPSAQRSCRNLSKISPTCLDLIQTATSTTQGPSQLPTTYNRWREPRTSISATCSTGVLADPLS